MRTRSRGANHIGFALMLTVLMLFVYGIMEYGWMSFQRTAVQEAGLPPRLDPRPG